MEFFANLTAAIDDPGAWAAEREAEGYHGVGCADHLWMTSSASPKAYPHLWVSLAAMAARTTTVLLTPAFANNLFRSPVEFAQASLQLACLSGGRYEAGLGAGWTEAEMTLTGRTYPDGRTRARMLAESLQIVRSLFADGQCRFRGEHYDIDVPVIGPRPATAPPLVASVGSPWTMRNIPPLVDQVELKLGRTTHGGTVDFAAMGTVTTDEVRRMVDTVRSAAPGVKVSMLVFLTVGTGARVEALTPLLAGGIYGPLCGPDPRPVAEALLGFADLGIDRLQVSEFNPGSITSVAAELRVLGAL